MTDDFARIQDLKLPPEPSPHAPASSAFIDPHKMAMRIALGAVEVITGYRHARTLQRWLVPHLYQSLCRRAGVEARCGAPVRRPARVLASSVTHPAPGVLEVSVVLHDTRKVRACGVRMESRVGGGWRAEALDLP